MIAKGRIGANTIATDHGQRVDQALGLATVLGRVEFLEKPEVNVAVADVARDAAKAAEHRSNGSRRSLQGIRGQYREHDTEPPTRHAKLVHERRVKRSIAAAGASQQRVEV